MERTTIMIVAVDGPSGAGKSSVCREVAKRLNWQLLDTGAIYRAVALLAIENALPEDDEAGAQKLAKNLTLRFEPSPSGQRLFLGDRDVSQSVRSFEVTQRVNRISAMASVRRELLDIQRRLAGQGHCIVEGRDIASVVFPNASLKIFYTASLEARTKRRLLEFQTKGEKALSYESVLEQIRLRDETEYSREHSPLIRCEDAILLDSSALNFEEACQALIDKIRERAAELHIAL